LEHSKSSRRRTDHHPAFWLSSLKEAEMKPTILALSLTALSLALWPASEALAQEQKVARGTITDVGGTSITLTVQGEPHTFTVDRQTRVEAPGGGTKMRQATVNGKAGPHLPDLLTVGQSAAVTYKDMPNPRASLIRAIPGVKTGGSVKTASAMRSIGIVRAVGADWVTIGGSSGGGAMFSQTFTIGPDTTVVGKGAGTASAAAGGKAPVTQLISAGDRVSISYHKTETALLASDVRIVQPSFSRSASK
jgi:hypothetical protein